MSGTNVVRPSGQLGEGKFGPTRELDYEMEVGLFVGPGNALGEPIPIGEARSHVAGVCLVNDWSARDVQRWEYQPLGPFLAKNFATIGFAVGGDGGSRSRRSGPTAAPHDVPILPYLQEPGPGALDVQVEVWLRTAAMTQDPFALSSRGVQGDVLDAGADGGAPRVERVPARAGRFDRQRHRLRPGEGEPRVLARTHFEGHRPGSTRRAAKREPSSKTATK